MIKVENKSTLKTPKQTEATIQSVMEVIPRDHLKGLNRVVLVDKVGADARLDLKQVSALPGLYHPKQGMNQPWHEIALGVMLNQDSLMKRLAARLNYKANLAYILLSLQAQHYYLTFGHGLKKHQYEGAVRSYVEKYHRAWSQNQGGWRVKLFKPLQPYLEKWVRSLKKKADAAK